MYEFLAPWGVFVPLISFAITYFCVTEARRRESLREMREPLEDEVSSYGSKLPPLSATYG